MTSALWDGRIFGLVAPGYNMARVIVSQIIGVDVASIGDAHGKTPGALSYVCSDEANEVYKRLVVSEENTRLLGTVLVGDVDA
ncbi:MAG: nitrite reductase (NADH) large subunit [Porticoccus sp.]|jgi:nitrite reductase (NADH) large subunit